MHQQWGLSSNEKIVLQTLAESSSRNTSLEKNLKAINALCGRLSRDQLSVITEVAACYG